MLGAGFVTTALADEPRNCNIPNTNQCCIDEQTINTTIANSTTSPKFIRSTDGYRLAVLSYYVGNDGMSGTCMDETGYLPDDGSKEQGAVFEWTPGFWSSTIKMVK